GTATAVVAAAADARVQAVQEDAAEKHAQDPQAAGRGAAGLRGAGAPAADSPAPRAPALAAGDGGAGLGGLRHTAACRGRVTARQPRGAAVARGAASIAAAGVALPRGATVTAGRGGRGRGCLGGTARRVRAAGPALGAAVAGVAARRRRVAAAEV